MKWLAKELDKILSICSNIVLVCWKLEYRLVFSIYG